MARKRFASINKDVEHVFLVFDGHGGKEAAKYAERIQSSNVYNYLIQSCLEAYRDVILHYGRQ